MRNVLNFNDNWSFQRKPEETFAPVTLPHTWNAIDGQDGGNDYYRGECLYEKRFPMPAHAADEGVWLEVDGAAMTAIVTLNGKELATHKGGYSRFRVELTEALGEENTLQISVDNSDNTEVYPQKADFTFYGGLYRDVKLLVVPRAHFALGYCGTPGIKVTPTLSDDLKSAEVEVTVYTENADGHAVTVSAANETKSAIVENGSATACFSLENVHLWDGLDDPYLYTASAALDSGDEVSARFGCRRFDFDAQKGFFLNGRSYPLRGVSRHQDRKGKGNALSYEDHAADMAIIREIGANTLRLAHYQHAQEFYDLCDENGLVVWAEIPYITMHMSGGRADTLSQMEELVVQNYNHPSVAVWGLSNEITAASAVDEELLENHRALNDLCHRLDPTRKTTMANVFMLEIDSPILEIPDINSYNLYFGWYLGELEQNEEFFDEYHAKYPERVIGFSEYGADANPQFQSALPEKGDYTESYQALYHEHMAQIIEARPWLWATHVWNLFDFAADGRDEGGKHGENQKGLVSFDRTLRKDAFYLYKAYWNKTEPFVHLCGSRYVDRAESVTEIKIYSNQDSVSLYVNGKLFETLKAHRVFRFSLPLEEIGKEHQIIARAGDAADAMTIRRVAEPNESYMFVKRSPVTNWFDADDFDPSCFSVGDRLGEIQAHPKAGPIIGAMMARGASERGDVAEAVKDNPALQRMMARMTLLSLLKQGGADEASIQQLNRVLQTIKKDV